MTSRTLLLLDRVATLLVAALLIAVGAGAIWWWTGNSSVPDVLDATSASNLVAETWWPWASAAAGVLLILLGLRWVVAHLAHRGVASLNLEGSGPAGQLDVAGSKIAGAAADAFSDTLGVRSATGRIVRDRGQLVARLRATIEPEADLHRVAAQADLVSAQLASALDRDDVRCSIELKVAARGGRLPRAS